MTINTKKTKRESSEGDDGNNNNVVNSNNNIQNHSGGGNSNVNTTNSNNNINTIISGDDNTNNGMMIMNHNADTIKENIDSMKQQFYNQKLVSLQEEIHYAKNKCEQIHIANYVKIPKNIRSMKIHEFDSLYNCDIISIVQRIRFDNNKKNGSNSGTTNHHPATQHYYHDYHDQQREQPAIMETPLPNNSTNGRWNTVRNRQLQQTPLTSARRGRQPNKGDLVATVVSKKNYGGCSRINGMTEMGISIGDGTILPLTDDYECIKELNKEDKCNALDQVKILQEQLARIATMLET